MGKVIVDLPGPEMTALSPFWQACFAVHCKPSTPSPTLASYRGQTARADTSPTRRRVTTTQATGSVVPCQPTGHAARNKPKSHLPPPSSSSLKGRPDSNRPRPAAQRQEMPGNPHACCVVSVPNSAGLPGLPTKQPRQCINFPRCAACTVFFAGGPSVPAPVPVPDCRETHATEAEKKRGKKQKMQNLTGGG